MDVDNNEIDLISQFRSMRTNDKECLIDEFRRLSNTELSNEGCAFYLDLANWNLNTALWAYYEYDAQDLINLPSMKFLCDITIGEGESVPPNTQFIKTWRIKNTGSTKWPPGCNLRLVNGCNLNQKDLVIVDPLEIDQEYDVSVQLHAPAQAGTYQSQYRLFTPTGTPFGDCIWLVLNVEEGGILGITQQLNSVNILGAHNNNNNNNNNTIVNHQINKHHECVNNTSCDVCNINSSTTAILPFTSNLPHVQQAAAQQEPQQQQQQSVDDDKRPEFYDEMFS